MSQILLAGRLLPALLLLTAACATAQSTRTLDDDDWCDKTNNWNTWGGDQGRFVACEVRETVLSGGRLAVESQNGSVTVRPWDRSDVLVRARVASRGRTQAEAGERVRATRIDAARGSVRAQTPRGRNVWVSVDYEVFAPAQTALTLRTTNGGLSAEGMAGAFDAQTVNGGISVKAMTGAVRARTTNGGISAALGGRGGAHDLRTTNGGIQIDLPRDYSGDLAASTRVGRISTSGLDLRDERRERGRYVGDQIEGRIGRGGATLSAVTQNGGITIRGGR